MTLPLNADAIVKYVTVVISLAALGVSFAAYHVASAQRDIARTELEVTRQHYRLSVRPRVRIVPYLEGPGYRNGIYIINVGLGPAIIKSVQIMDGSTTYQLTELRPLIQLLRNMHLNSRCFQKASPLVDSVIRAGEETPIIARTRRVDTDCDIPVVSLVAKNSLRFKVAYESMYEEAFTIEDSAVIKDSENLQLIEPQGSK
jgi:hypothetical protein